MDGQRPQFSPDGKLIAYWAGVLSGSCLEDRGLARIFVVAVGGGEPRQLQSDFIAAALPVWAPDSEHLLFLGNPDNRKPLEKTVDWWVTSLFSGPAVKTGALDVTQRARLSGDFQLYPWTLVPGAWQRDDNVLVFSARYGDTRNLWRLRISPKTFRVTGSEERLTSGAAREEQPAVAVESGGTVRLVFTSVSDTLSIWSLPIEANQGSVRGDPKRLTSEDATGGFHPALSPDGTKMVWISGRSGAQEIWIRNLKTGEESAITGSRKAKWIPLFSPDGSKVSFSEHPSQNLYIVPAVGGVPEMICEGCGEANGWSPNGKYLIGDTADGQGWVFELASRRRTDVVISQRRPINAASFSPDGRWFLLGAGNPFRTYIVPFEKLPAPENTWIDIMDSWNGWQWSPDGGLVYSLSDRDGFECIWARRVDRTTKRPVGEPFAVFHAHNVRLALSDLEDLVALGRDKMLFSMRERTGNIWMAEFKEQQSPK
jgi:Tol biopolymer transport system component